MGTFSAGTNPRLEAALASRSAAADIKDLIEAPTDIVETKTADYTLVAADSGKTFIAGAVDLTFTLPATISGFKATFIVATVSATTGCSISPNASDKIIGNAFAGTDDKDAINTAATDVAGDAIEIVGDGSDGWYIKNIIGTWALEA
jgi:hypothetical protein